MSSNPSPIAVLDTNVLLDVFSCHDVFLDHQKRTLVSATTDPEALYRRERAKYGLLLAAHFHKLGATTWGLRGEAIRKTLELVPPEAENHFPRDYLQFFLDVLKPKLFSDWVAHLEEVPGDPTGNAADIALVVQADQLGVPLITNEGKNPGKARKSKLIRAAKAQGVTWMSPKAYCQQHIVEAEEVAWLLKRAAEEEANFPTGMTNTGKVAPYVGGYFHLVLVGRPGTLSKAS